MSAVERVLDTSVAIRPARDHLSGRVIYCLDKAVYELDVSKLLVNQKKWEKQPQILKF